MRGNGVMALRIEIVKGGTVNVSAGEVCGRRSWSTLVVFGVSVEVWVLWWNNGNVDKILGWMCLWHWHLRGIVYLCHWWGRETGMGQVCRRMDNDSILSVLLSRAKSHGGRSILKMELSERTGKDLGRVHGQGRSC